MKTRITEILYHCIILIFISLLFNSHAGEGEGEQEQLPKIESAFKWHRSSRKIPTSIPMFKWVPLNTTITFSYEVEKSRMKIVNEEAIARMAIQLPSNRTEKKGHFYAAIELVRTKSLYMNHFLYFHSSISYISFFLFL